MISYQVIKQEMTELHLNSDYLRLVYGDYPEGSDDYPYIIVEGFITDRETSVPLTAINEYDFSIVQDQIDHLGSYLFSTAGFPIVRIVVCFPEINSMDENERSSSSSLGRYGSIEVSWEEK